VKLREARKGEGELEDRLHPDGGRILQMGGSAPESAESSPKGRSSLKKMRRNSSRKKERRDVAQEELSLTGKKTMESLAPELGRNPSAYEIARSN